MTQKTLPQFDQIATSWHDWTFPPQDARLLYRKFLFLSHDRQQTFPHRDATVTSQPF